jgi:tetratricopeptide (TPR) repeat protein
MPSTKYISPLVTFLICFIALGSAFPADSGNSRSLIYDPLSLQEPPWGKAALAGNKFWEEGDEAGAIREWEKAISQGFSDGLAFYYLGRYYARLEDWDKAITYLSKAKPRIIDENKDPEVLENLYEILATAYMKNRRYYESYIHYQKALNLEPDSSSLHLGLANLYLLRGKLSEAEKEAKQVLVKSPSMARAFWIIAAAAEKREEYPAAIDYYRKYLSLEPDRWEARLSLGLLLHYQMKQSDRAEKELDRVVALVPEDSRAYAALGVIYLGRGQIESARKAADMALKYDPENYQALIIRGQLYLQNGDDIRAENYFQKALRINPDGALAVYWVGVIQFQKGDYQAAESSFRRSVNLAPGFRDAALNHGLALEVLGRSGDALRQLKQVVSLHPDFALGHLGLGRLYYYAGEPEKALTFFRNALALDRASWEPYYFIGKCLYDRNDNEEALEYYLAARKRERENPRILTDLALAYDRTNRPALAEEMLNEALEYDPGYLRAMLRLGVLKAREDDLSGAKRLYRQAIIIRPGDVNWGNQGEQRDFLVRMISGVEDYLGAGIDYLSLYAVMKNISRDQGVFTELIPVLVEKVRRNPLKPEYPHLLGMAYQEKGDLPQAEKYYILAVRNDSDFAAAHLSLGQLYAGEKKYDLARKHLQAVLSLAPESAMAPTIKEVLKNLPE